MKNFPIKVLLIDDDEEDYILTRYIFDEFKSDKFSLEWIDNYADGLEALKKRLHDIILLDYHLGEKNGCRAPIILLTGQGDEEIDLQAMQAGAADYLVKSELEAPLLERSIRYSLEHAYTLQAYRESEARYRNLVETLPVMFYAVEPTPPY
jgi:two-component system cell cycle sensor histidine kinase/response regulator CckA